MAEELKKKIFDFLHELPQKQGELEELHLHCNTEQLSKQELLAEVESLKLEVSNLQAQLDLTNKVLHKCEENFKAAKDSAVKHQLGLEATARCGEKMKEEAIRLQTENSMLKKQIENLEKETKTETFFRESCIKKQSKMQVIIESLNNQMRNLEKDFRDVERKSNETLSIGNKNKLVSENKDLTIKQLKEKTEFLTAQITSLTSEVETLKLNENINRPVEQNYVRDIMKEWQNSINEMNIRTQNFERESEVLHQSLDIAHKEKLTLQKFEEAANEKVRQIQAKLKEVENKERKRSTDCSVQTDLTSAIEVGCQTTRVEVANVVTQTDNVEDVQMQDKDKSMEPQKSASQSYQNVPAYTFSNALLTQSFKYSSSSVSQLMSRFQKEKAKQELEEAEVRLSLSQDISEIPTQLNLGLINK